MAEILANVYRGELVESCHRGDWVITDVDGGIVHRQGDPGKRTYWRSSAKPFQAVPVVESGAYKAYGLRPEELAVMCASHSGEGYHVDAVQSILRKIGLNASYLQCGVHPPVYRPAAEALACQGRKPDELHSNCSGKHSGMLALCRYFGWDLQTYLEPRHPLQQMTLQYVSEVTGTAIEDIVIGVDGCGVPVFGLTLQSMARAWALLAAPSAALTGERAAALRTVADAMRDHPHMVAGTERLCTDLMRGYAEVGLVAKMGAEAVYCIGLPNCGWGLALKVEDGSSRAVPAIVLSILNQLGYSSRHIPELEKYVPLLVKNHRQRIVGRIDAEVLI